MKQQQLCALIGIFLLIVGAILRYQVGRRRFNRRSITGLQRFNSYSDSLVTRGGEGLTGCLGALLLVLGALLTFVGFA